MLALIYADLPPNDKKMSRQQIDSQFSLNQPMRIRMTYACLVMIHYYKNKQDNNSQWTAINDRLRVLRASSKEFQQVHAQLVMDKDDQLFLHKRHINQITKDECVVPTLNDVRAAMAAGMVLRVGPPGCDLSGVAIATPLPSPNNTRLDSHSHHDYNGLSISRPRN
ncbi:hypothetical protein PGT21_032173 [Puccinia graminis f. sp. tritici]|uniref:Uncharacterized protein n=1 Tax=Puccinia graminis f. sp. tritici TaxID=56615 RepID=A0A5B0NZY2_PUCGR|nr:hypothetical protein PGT21_032173 [Puccinia graminis f. sp. tritici]